MEVSDIMHIFLENVYYPKESSTSHRNNYDVYALLRIQYPNDGYIFY